MRKSKDFKKWRFKETEKGGVWNFVTAHALRNHRETNPGHSPDLLSWRLSKNLNAFTLKRDFRASAFLPSTIAYCFHQTSILESPDREEKSNTCLSSETENPKKGHSCLDVRLGSSILLAAPFEKADCHRNPPEMSWLIVMKETSKSYILADFHRNLTSSMYCHRNPQSEHNRNWCFAICGSPHGRGP